MSGRNDDDWLLEKNIIIELENTHSKNQRKTSIIVINELGFFILEDNLLLLCDKRSYDVSVDGYNTTYSYDCLLIAIEG